MPHSFLFLSFLLVTTAATLPVNVTRLKLQITELATHNDLTPPAVQRILYTPSDVSARTYLNSLFSAADLSIHEDALGNLFATWPGIESGPGVLTGSHFDAIPNSGMFDGTLGILSAVEAITALKEDGYVPRRSITILALTSEEPTRFGLSCIGSRLLAGAIRPDQLTQLKDSVGIPFDSARSAAGYSGDIATVPLSIGDYSAFVELHSEQGPILEDTHTEIGVVTAIAAPAALSVTYTGPGGHAGTTLMSSRKDPSLAASELSLIVESAVKRFGGDDTVGTTGFVEITPNAVNSVPTMAKIGIDIRDIDRERRDKILAIVENAARVIAKKRDVGVEVVINSRDPPATCDDNVVKAVVDTANEQGLTHRKMVSRAYHDALFMAGVIPTGMIFVPCRGGVSHRPDEYVADRDMENGVKVLAGVLKRLAGDAIESDDTAQVASEKQAEKITVEGVKTSADEEEKFLNGTPEPPESLATESDKEYTNGSGQMNLGAVETQLVSSATGVMTEAERGEVSTATGDNDAEMSTPSAARTTRGTRRSISRGTGASKKQEESASREPKASQTVENDSGDSPASQQSSKPIVTLDDTNEVDGNDGERDVKPDKSGALETVAEEPMGKDEERETEPPAATQIDTAQTEGDLTRKSEEANSDGLKAKKPKQVSDRKTRRKKARGRDFENGTTSKDSKLDGLRQQEKVEPAAGQTDSPETKEGAPIVSEYGIEGFDKKSENSFAAEKEDL